MSPRYILKESTEIFRKILDKLINILTIESCYHILNIYYLRYTFYWWFWYIQEIVFFQYSPYIGLFLYLFFLISFYFALSILTILFVFFFSPVSSLHYIFCQIFLFALFLVLLIHFIYLAPPPYIYSVSNFENEILVTHWNKYNGPNKLLNFLKKAV